MSPRGDLRPWSPYLPPILDATLAPCGCPDSASAHASPSSLPPTAAERRTRRYRGSSLHNGQPPPVGRDDRSKHSIQPSCKPGRGLADKRAHPTHRHAHHLSQAREWRADPRLVDGCTWHERTRRSSCLPVTRRTKPQDRKQNPRHLFSSPSHAVCPSRTSARPCSERLAAREARRRRKKPRSPFPPTFLRVRSRAKAKEKSPWPRPACRPVATVRTLVAGKCARCMQSLLQEIANRHRWGLSPFAHWSFAHLLMHSPLNRTGLLFNIIG